jgi:hypothetical protein
MSAILSTKFRTLNASRFFSNLTDSPVTDRIYIGVGKSDPWDTAIGGLTETVITPADDQSDFSEAYRNLIGMVLVPSTSVSHVVPRHDWVTGLSNWYQWDSRDSAIFDKKFYCLTDQNNVYKLIVKPLTGTSTDKPDHITVDPVVESDGYSWKYMYTLTAEEKTSFLTDNYMPVQTATAAGDRLTYQAKSAGTHTSGNTTAAQGIEAIALTAAGSSYESNPTVTITGDGTGATATAARDGLLVSSITVSDSPGSDYTVADVVISGGGGANATAEAIVAPGTGHGTDPVQELGGFYVLINGTLAGEGGAGTDLTVGNDFRQISIIRNPLKDDSPFDSPCTDLTHNPVVALQMAERAFADLYVTTEYVTGAAGAIGYVVRTANDASDSPNTGYVYITQNSKTGYGNFVNGENITGSVYTTPKALANTTGLPGAGKAGPKAANVLGEVKFGSGEMLFLENRGAITRSSNQSEDVKLVIEF